MTDIPLAGWTSEPNVRGTFRLLTGCLVTLSLCVYTALHLNVPKTGAGKMKTIYNKAKWVLLGVFAPELVVFTAWSQWMSARELTKIVNRHLDPKNGPSGSKVEWTLTHSFFAQMGGFAVDTNDPGEDPYAPGSPRLFFTANGVAILAEMGHLPNISKAFILDKSKADSLTKTLVIVQAGWLIIQCIARVVARLPLTFLELHTLAHAACALIMYFLWWNKPLDIREPVILSGPWVRPVVATMWMFSHVSTEAEYNEVRKWIMFPEIESLVLLQRQQMTVQLDGDTRGASAIQDGDNGASEESRPQSPHITIPRPTDDSFPVVRLPYGTNPEKHVQPTKSLYFTMYGGQVLLPFGFGPKSSSSRFGKRVKYEAPVPGYTYPMAQSYSISVRTTLKFTTIIRWKLATQCLNDHPDIWHRYRREMCPTYTVYDENQPVEHRTLYEYPRELCQSTFIDPRIPNWPWRDLIQHQNPYLRTIFFSICVLIYGGLHATAWNDYFPTDTERFCWRFSALYIAGSGIFYVAAKVLDALGSWIPKVFIIEGDVDDLLSSGCLGFLKWYFIHLMMLIIGAPYFLALFAYVAARVFVVLEAFISLRSLPAAVYQTPTWTQYLSHL